MRKFGRNFFISLFVSILATAGIVLWRDLGLRKEIWHDATASKDF
ncbi:hypothetical protein [Boudabousia liubingyangii]|nr:hypothetical protein [Boudabousia liubingyangii]